MESEMKGDSSGRGRDMIYLMPSRTDPGERYYRTGLLPQVVTHRRFAG